MSLTVTASQAATFAAASSLAADTTLGEWLPTIERRATLEQIGAVSQALADRLASSAGFPDMLSKRLQAYDIGVRGRALVELRDTPAHQEYLAPLRALPLTELGEEVVATFAVSPPVLSNGRPATFAGRHAHSILGYAAYRALTGTGNAVLSLVGRGWLWGGKTAAQRAYEPDRDRLRGRVRFQHTPAPTGTSSETATKHTEVFAAEITWAQNLRTDRISLHSAQGRTVLQEAERRMLGVRSRWRELYNDSVREFQDNPFTAKSPGEFARGHAATADARLRRSEAMLGLVLEGEKIEHDWQRHGYLDLIRIARDRGVKPKKLEALEAALESYEDAAWAYESLLEKGLAYDPDVRGDYKVKKAEQAVFMALWTLHNLTRQALKKHPEAHALRAPLTFSSRNQAYLLDGPGKGQAGLEPLFETVRLTKPVTDAGKAAMKKLESSGEPTPEARRQIIDAMEDGAIQFFGLPQVLSHFSRVTVAAPEGYPLLAHRDTEMATLARIEGGLLMLEAKPEERAEGGSITNAPHMATTDYAMQVVLAYLLGDERISIVAEEAFKHLPVFGDYIGLGGGVFISRKEIKALKDQMKGDITDRIKQLHRSVVIYGTGTRLLGDVLGNPHADLTNPAVLYIPGESNLSRFTTGQSAAEASRNQVPLKVVAQNLKRGGAIEPSIPRDRKGFKNKDQTAFGYVRPGMGPAFAAIAGVIPHEALLVSHAEGPALKFEALKRDAALMRDMEAWVAFGLDIGLG